MTALSVADEVLKVLDANYLAAPDPQWSQLGAPVMTCTSTSVGAISSTDTPLFPDNPRCGTIGTHTLTVVIARECGITFDGKGRTDPVKTATIARQMEADDEAISAAVAQFAAIGRVVGAPVTAYLNEGGLAAVATTVIVTE